MSKKPTLSTQIGISNSAYLTAANFSSGAPLPQISGLTRVYKSFQPEKAILTELIIGVFTNGSGAVQTTVAAVQDAVDLVLVSAFSGADNCFPNAPSEANGISGPAFAPNSLGNGISWPIIRGGIDMSVAFAVDIAAMAGVRHPFKTALRAPTHRTARRWPCGRFSRQRPLPDRSLWRPTPCTA